jgi:hypothetical protein
MDGGWLIGREAGKSFGTRGLQLISAVLNFFAGPFDVLAEAFSCVAARADDGQERGDE